MTQDEIRDTAEWSNVLVDALRRFNDRAERAKVAAKLRDNAGPKQRQTTLLPHLDDLPTQGVLFEEER